MARKFDNQKIELPNGETMTIGTWQGEQGELSVKLRLPEEWGLTQMFRGAPASESKPGKTVVVFDRGA